MKEEPFRADIYIVPTSKWYHTNNVLILIVITLITLLTVRKLIKNLILVRKNYELLFSTHPEVERDFNLLRNKAEYIDEVLKIIVYNGSLIFQKGKFTITDMAVIRKIDVGVYSEVDNINSKVYYINILDDVGNELRLDLPRKYFKNIKITRDRLDKLGEFLQEKYKVKIFYKY